MGSACQSWANAATTVKQQLPLARQKIRTHTPRVLPRLKRQARTLHSPQTWLSTPQLDMAKRVVRRPRHSTREQRLIPLDMALDTPLGPAQAPQRTRHAPASPVVALAAGLASASSTARERS